MGLKDVVIKEARPLPVMLLVDNSGSMANEKINTVNVALQEMLAEFKDIKGAKGKIHLGIITFGHEVTDMLPLTKIDDVSIPTFKAYGKTWMGKAIDHAIDILEDKSIVPSRSYTPTIILISDGLPTDCPGKARPNEYDFSIWEPIARLNSSDRLKKCPKLALGIGSDANYKMLAAFIGNPNIPVIKATELSTISKFFKWVTYSVSRRSVSSNPNEQQVVDYKEIFGTDEFIIPDLK